MCGHVWPAEPVWERPTVSAATHGQRRRCGDGKCVWLRMAIQQHVCGHASLPDAPATETRGNVVDDRIFFARRPKCGLLCICDEEQMWWFHKFKDCDEITHGHSERKIQQAVHLVMGLHITRLLKKFDEPGATGDRPNHEYPCGHAWLAEAVPATANCTRSHTWPAEAAEAKANSDRGQAWPGTRQCTCFDSKDGLQCPQ